MTSEPHTVTLRDPGDIITAVPAMLGFIPERSLVLVSFEPGGRRVAVTMRQDLDLDPDGYPTEMMEATVAHLCEVCLQHDASRVVAVVVDDRFELDHGCWDILFAEIDSGLDDVGLEAGFVVDDIARGRQWRTGWGLSEPYVGGGLLDDPRTCAMAVAQAVTTGRVVLRSRGEMVESTRPTDHCGDRRCGLGRAGTPAGGDLDDAELLRRVLDAVLIGVDRDTTCPEVMVLETAIRRVTVRDALLALAVSDVADAAEVLWAELTRRLRGSGRACAAALLGHLNYVRGDGAMAGVAFDRALESDPDHSLARLLDRSLRAGMRPSTLAELLPTSYAAAEKLGVVLPGPAERDAG